MTVQNSNDNNGKVTKYRLIELEKYFNKLGDKLERRMEDHCNKSEEFERKTLIELQKISDTIIQNQKEIWELKEEQKENIKPRLSKLERWKIKYSSAITVLIGLPVTILAILQLIKFIQSW